MDKTLSLWPIDIWIPKQLILPECKPVYLLIHTTPSETKTELLFWNTLRDTLKSKIKVRYFEDSYKAGPIILFPNTLYEYSSRGMLRNVLNYSQELTRSGRKVILFANEYTARPGEIVFSGSTYRSKYEKSISTPYWLYDLGKQVSPLEKPVTPTLGFVGNTTYSGLLSSLSMALPIPEKAIFWLAGNLKFNRSTSLRVRQPLARLVRKTVLDKIKDSEVLKTDFIERDKVFFNLTSLEKERYRQEFISNIERNPYHLCVRGDDNGSYRLYEVMSAGRIPIIIDTKVALPKLESLKWEEFSIIVSPEEICKLGSVINLFHKSLSKDGFKEVCLKSRMAYEQLLPHNFLIKALNDLSEELVKFETP